MLIKLVEHIKKSNTLKHPFKGIVVDNNDPKQIGRVKATVKGIIEGDTALLPWILPWSPTGIGGRGDASAFSTLAIGSEIIVEFPYDDIYSPFYTGMWQSSLTHNGTYNEDYPYSYGFIDDKGNGYKVDRAKQITDYTHSSNTRVQFQKDGTVELKSKKGIRFLSEDGKTELFIDLENGSFAITPKDSFQLGGQKTRVTSNELEISVASIKETVSGSKESQVVGGYKQTVGGSYSEAILSNKAISVGGNKSELIAGTTEVIHGLGRKETIPLGDKEELLVLGSRKSTLTAGNIEDTILAGDKKATLTLGDLLETLAAGDRKVQILLGDCKFDLTAGDYDVNIVSGNIVIKTNLGTLSFGSNLASIDIDATGAMTIMATTTFEVDALVSATLKAPLVNVGPGASPGAAITVLTMPVWDLITGIPSVGVPTVLIG